MFRTHPAELATFENLTVLGGHVFALGEHGYRIYRLPVLTLEPTKLPRPLKNDVVPLLLRDDRATVACGHSHLVYLRLVARGTPSAERPGPRVQGACRTGRARAADRDGAEVLDVVDLPGAWKNHLPLALMLAASVAAAPTAAAAQTMPTEFQGKWCAVGDERSNQLLLPQARMSIPARDDMVVPGGLAAATIACVISMAAQRAMDRSRVMGAGAPISDENGGTARGQSASAQTASSLS